MSWSDSLLSPTGDYAENNPYRQSLADTNIDLPPTHNAQTYPFTFERPPAPRLSSPRLFRDTLYPPATSGISNLPHLPRPLTGDFDNTLRDVQSALHNADMALRNAQAAFRHSRATRSNTNNVVDLTGSDDINENEAFLNSDLDPRPISRWDARNARPHRNARPFMMTTTFTGGDRVITRRERIAEREWERRERVRERARGERVEDTDSEEGQSDMNYPETEEDESDETEESEEEVTPARMPSVRQILQQGNSTSQADRSAVRRQRQARRDWERVERRNRERAHQQAQNDAHVESQRNQAEEHDSTQRSAGGQNSNGSVSASSSIDLTQDNKEDNPSEPVDLTGADDDKTLKNILAKEQQDAIAAQPKPPSAGNATSSLSNYKCAICMDSPENATTTICGHLFCHKCILDSLKWSERQRREDALHPRTVNGLCPVCRKPLKNKEISGRGPASGGLVNLEIKKIPRKQFNDDRQREKFLADIEAGKGKQRANTEDVADIENIDTGDYGSDGPGKVPRKRRRGQS